MALQAFQECISAYSREKVNQTVSESDTMWNQWYWQVGESAVMNVALAIASSNVTSVNHVLDLPCGHGRVLRHLTVMFPKARFYACDLDRGGVDFCSKTLGAHPFYSREELTEVVFPTTFDLIWVGSLFTHISRDLTRRWLNHLARFLTPSGIIVATTHGRWCESVHRLHPYIAEQSWESVLREYRSTGYGYADYASSESHDYIAGSYGISLVKPHAFISDLEGVEGTRIFMYRERGWADHQDVVAFGKPSVDEKWPGM